MSDFNDFDPRKRQVSMGVHQLVGGTLTRESGGFVARCTCGWSSGERFSSLAASAAFRDHQDGDEA